MGWFSGETHKTIALIEIGSSSVGGAYLVSDTNGLRMVYTTRISMAKAGVIGMVRALSTLERLLVEQGAPLVHSLTGSGKIDETFVCVRAPWQTAEVRTEVIQNESSFLVTKELLKGVLKRDETRRNEKVLATILNGYNIRTPFGRRAKRAEVVILSSQMELETEKLIRQGIRRICQGPVKITSFPEIADLAIRTAFPHEKDCLAIGISGEATDLALTHRGVLTHAASLELGQNIFSEAAKIHGVSSMGAVTDAGGLIDPNRNAAFSERLGKAQTTWVSEVGKHLKEFATHDALPRTIFLFAEESVTEFFSRIINAPELHALWLSDEPLTVLTVKSTHLENLLKRDPEVANDLNLSMLAAAWTARAYPEH